MVPKSLALQRAETHGALDHAADAVDEERPLSLRRRAQRPRQSRRCGSCGCKRQVQHAERYYTPEELQLIVQESEDLGALRAESGPDAAGAVRVRRSHGGAGDGAAGADLGHRARHDAAPSSARCSARTPHTRYPIYERDLDHIVGMIHIKDVLRLLLQRRDGRPGACAPAAADARDGGTGRRPRHDAARADADGRRPRRARRHRRHRDAAGSLRRGRRRDRRRAGGCPAGLSRRLRAAFA